MPGNQTASAKTCTILKYAHEGLKGKTSMKQMLDKLQREICKNRTYLEDTRDTSEILKVQHSEF